MSFSRDRWVLGAAIVTESGWLYGVLAVAGLAAGMGAGVLDWPMVLLTMGLSAVLVRVGLFDRLSAGVAGPVRSLTAGAFIYVVAGVTVATDEPVVNLAWIFSISYETAPEGFVVRSFAAVAAAVALWLRGARLGAVGRPEASLTLSFRIGLVALAFATLIDVLHPADIGIFPVLFVFFASGLAGLSIGSLIPESSEFTKGPWHKVIALVVVGVVAVGLAFSVLHRALLSFLSDQFDTIGSIGQVVLIVMIAPFAILFELFNNLLFGFFSRPFDPEAAGAGQLEAPEVEGPEIEIGPGQGAGRVSDDATGDSVLNLDPLLQVLWYLFLAGIAVVLVIVLAIAIRRMTAPRRLGARGEPENLKGDSNPISDLARLLANIVPRWARKSGKGRLRLPDGPPGVVEALKIYYDLVTLAEKRGTARSPDQTPTEYQPSLEGIFPKSLVRAATAAFNRAFYGRIPATDKQLAQMHAAIAPVRGGSRIMRGRGR